MLKEYGDMLTVKDSMEILHKTQAVIYRLLREKKIIGYHCGYRWIVPKANLVKYIGLAYERRLRNW